MSDDTPPEPAGDGEAWKTGVRRATAHLLRAGYEILAGLNAFLEEIAASHDDDPDDDSGGGRRTRIDVE